MQTHHGNANIPNVVLHEFILHKVSLQQECVVTECDDDLIANVQGFIEGVLIGPDQFKHIDF